MPTAIRALLVLLRVRPPDGEQPQSPEPRTVQEISLEPTLAQMAEGEKQEEEHGQRVLWLLLFLITATAGLILAFLSSSKELAIGVTLLALVLLGKAVNAIWKEFTSSRKSQREMHEERIRVTTLQENQDISRTQAVEVIRKGQPRSLPPPKEPVESVKTAAQLLLFKPPSGEESE